MKYIQKVRGVFDLTAYEQYLDGEREALSALVGGPDLLVIERFVPTGPGSFHDARLVRLQVTSSAAGPRNGGGVQVDMRLKGPYFDRYFELGYRGVTQCMLETPGPDDDLLMHEIRLEGECLVHRFLFDPEKVIEVRSRTLEFREERM